MNVGIAVHRYSTSEGTGGYVVRLLPHLAREHRVTLYAARVEADVPTGVDVVHVPAVMTTAYTAILSFPFALQLVRCPHDVMHAQGFAAHRADVVTTHIVMAGWREAARDAHVRSRPGERLLGRFVERREAALVRSARQVIVPSALARQDVERHYGRTDGVSVIHHGFPEVPRTVIRDQARATLGLPASGFVAAFVGDPRKGLRFATQAAAAVEGVHLAVASYGDRRAALALAERHGVRGRVHWLAGASMDDVYAAADALVHPTIYDTFGLVVAEAMSRGVPVITTRRAGIAELLTHETSAWLMDRPDWAAVAAGLRALVRDEALRRRMADSARAVAKARPWDVVARETLAVYERAR